MCPKSWIQRIFVYFCVFLPLSIAFAEYKYFPQDAEELRELIENTNIPLAEINTSAIIDMEGLFENSKRTNEQFKGIETWDVSNVKSMNRMFYNAESFNQPIGNWNVSNVENMGEMFYNAKSFNQPIGDWNVSNVGDMGGMFCGAKSFNQPIGNWRVGRNVVMYRMFANTNFAQDLSSWGEKDSFNIEANE